MRSSAWFRCIGEALAESGVEKETATEIIKNLAQNVYPKNKHRRWWGNANMNLFYDNEKQMRDVIDKGVIEVFDVQENTSKKKIGKACNICRCRTFK